MTYQSISVASAVHREFRQLILDRQGINHLTGMQRCQWKASASSMLDYLINFYHVVSAELIRAAEEASKENTDVMKVRFMDIFPRSIDYRPTKTSHETRINKKIPLVDLIESRKLFMTKFGYEPTDEQIEFFATKVLKCGPLTSGESDAPIQTP